MTSPLLPITKGRYAHTDHKGKLVLRLLELLPNCLDVFRFEHELPTRLSLTAKNAPTFTNALDQLIKIFRVHLNSCCTAFARICFLVNSEIFLLALAVEKQHKDDLALSVPVVDNPQPATFSTTHFSPSKLPDATGSLNQIALLRTTKKCFLKKPVVII